MKNFEKWYNNWLNNLDEKVPETVWDDIQDELDLQDVWQKLEKHYDGNPLPHPGGAVKDKHLWKQLATSSLILLLILGLPLRVDHDTDDTTQPLASILLLNEIDDKGNADTTTHLTSSEDYYYTVPANEKESTVAASNTELNSKQETYMEEAVANKIHENEKVAEQGFVMADPQQEGNQQRVAALTVQDQMPDIRKNLPMLASIPLERKTLVSLGITDKDKLLLRLISRAIHNHEISVETEAPIIEVETEALFVKDSESAIDNKKENKVRLAYIGPMAGMKNTWLLNHETFNGLKSSTLSATLPTYRKEAGAVAAVQIKEKHNIATELFWRSEGGQQYREYINASYVERDIKLSYLKAQTYYMLSNKFFPGELLAGGYIAYLNDGEEHLHMTVRDISADYTAFDYGLLTGYQANVRLLGKLHLLPSVRLNYNLNNIFSGNDELPASFKRTRNASISLNIGLVYRY